MDGKTRLKKRSSKAPKENENEERNKKKRVTNQYAEIAIPPPLSEKLDCAKIIIEESTLDGFMSHFNRLTSSEKTQGNVNAEFYEVSIFIAFIGASITFNNISSKSCLPPQITLNFYLALYSLRLRLR